MKHHTTPRPIVAKFIGSSTCTACGLTSCCEAPALELARQLVKAGHDPDRPLHVYRGRVLALTITSIASGAKLEVTGKGTGFRMIPEVGTASPVRKSDGARCLDTPQLGAAP